MDQNKSNYDENSKAGDPNMCGSSQSKKVNDRPAGRFSPSQEYDQNEPFHGPKQ